MSYLGQDGYSGDYYGSNTEFDGFDTSSGAYTPADWQGPTQPLNIGFTTGVEVTAPAPADTPYTPADWQGPTQPMPAYTSMDWQGPQYSPSIPSLPSPSSASSQPRVTPQQAAASQPAGSEIYWWDAPTGNVRGLLADGSPRTLGAATSDLGGISVVKHYLSVTLKPWVYYILNGVLVKVTADPYQVFQTPQGSQTAPTAQAAVSATPSWLWFVLIAGGALLLLNRKGK